MSIPEDRQPYTDKQGQYLAYIYLYNKINGRPPAEHELQRFFKVSPPSVHRMILDLEKKGLISRVPSQPRSITIRLSPDQLPNLKDVN